MSKDKNNFENSYYRIPNFIRKKFKLSVFQLFIALQIDIIIRKQKKPFQLRHKSFSDYFDLKESQINKEKRDNQIKDHIYYLKQKNVIYSEKRGFYNITEDFKKSIYRIPYVEVVPELKDKLNLKDWDSLYYLLFIYTVTNKGTTKFFMSRRSCQARTGYHNQTQEKLEEYLIDKGLLITPEDKNERGFMVNNDVNILINEVKNSVKIYHDVQREISKLSKNQDNTEKKAS